jgi:pyruvate,water dikinase
MLIEIARRTGDYVPDVSFGTHFFQDLVEARIRYLPLYPDEPDVVFREQFLLEAENLLARLLPEHAALADCVRVVDVPAAADGRVVRVYLNADREEALAALEQPDVSAQPQLEAGGPTLHEPKQYWRWRFRMAERMVRALDAEAFGVEAVYLYGSVKNGTAGPGSDIDLLVHVRDEGCRREKLEAWFEGWGQALAEMNYSRTGVMVPRLLDVTYLTDADIARGEGLAARINAPTDPARRLGFA